MSTPSTSTSTSTAAPVLAPTGARVRIGQVVLSALLALSALVAVSTAFSDDPFPGAAVVLIATFGVLAAVFGLVVVWSVRASRAARVAVWALPLFFVVHVAALGTWVPDAAFAVVAATGALLVSATPVRR